MKKDEQAVQDLLTCIVEFDADPFDPSNPTLRSLQSGLLATPELVTDFVVALQDGKIEAETILHERVFTKTRSLTATIHTNKRRNFASEQICVPSGASMNVALMERSGMVALVDLAEGASMINLESALEGRVTEECLSMFNVDGLMRKTCKSKLLQLFSMEPVTEIPQGYISLVDMGLIWRLATPTPEDREAKRRDGSEYRWIDYLDKILVIIISRHADAHIIILVNDRYDIPYSIKDDERDRRAAKYPHIANVFPKPDDKFPTAVEFNKVMVNSTNKVRLQKLVLKHMKTRVAQLPCGVLYCEGERVTNLNTDMATGDYRFKHLEADTMLLSIYAKLRTANYTNTVVLDSEDTDVYVQAAYVSHQIGGKLLIKRKQALVNCHSMLPYDVSNVIVPLHVLTGSDHTSGFYGHGKKPLLQKLMKDPEARELLRRVGESLELKDEVKADMKAFILSKVYGEDIALTCGQARASKWQKLKKKSTARLPPDDDTLNHHCARTNYITYCQLHFTLVEHSTPIGHGWEIINGKCQPVRYTLPPLPHQVMAHEHLPNCSDESGSDDDSGSGESTDSDE